MEVDLSDRLKRVLLFIGENGPFTGYSLAAQLKMPRSSTYDALKILSEKNLVKAHPVRSWGAILEKKEYDLTVKGAVTVLKLVQTREEIDRVARKWGSLLPLVFGKWDYLKEYVREAILYSRLDLIIDAFLSPSSHASSPIWSNVNLTGIIPEDDENVFTAHFYDLTLISREYLNWDKALSGDPDISKFIIKLLPGYETSIQLLSQALEYLREILEGGID